MAQCASELEAKVNFWQLRLLSPLPPPSPWFIAKWFLSPHALLKRRREENMAFRDRFCSSGSEVNLISENEPDDNFEDDPDPCPEEEEEIDLGIHSPSDDK